MDLYGLYFLLVFGDAYLIIRVLCSIVCFYTSLYMVVSALLWVFGEGAAKFLLLGLVEMFSDSSFFKCG